MTKEEHRKRHVELHQALGELVADWLEHQPLTKMPKGLSGTSILELMEWSHRQTIEAEALEDTL